MMEAPVPTPPSSPSSPSPLPLCFRDSPPLLITQGAEALLYRTTYLLPSRPAALKFRPPKAYRHPTLDSRLTKHRILSEARVLVRCRKEGVPVPAVYALDEKSGWLLLEWITGDVLRVCLNRWYAGLAEAGPREAVLDLLRKIGGVVGRLHAAGIVHGDLTTSNLMLRPGGGETATSHANENQLQGDVVLIDFGLASQSSHEEDRAVDLYVLERAFVSTHPWAETLFAEVLKVYGKSFRGADAVLKRLEDVRMRGRKRSMLG